MHCHRIAAFLAGCWILGSLFMMFVATQNFQAVDRVLAAPDEAAAPLIQTLGNGNSRVLLRQLVADENAFYFESWELAELVLGTLLAGFLLLGARRQVLAGLAVAMVALAAFQHFRVTPEMIAMARSLEPASSRADFGRLHALYGILEIVKLGLAVGIAAAILPAWRGKSLKKVAPDAGGLHAQVS
ncbi:MAG TPA: hypothetical protein VMB25_25565 [Bryobacteraceae bacterium]|nr:hypothetical protein [Bryobacteraceae bacterium]